MSSISFPLCSEVINGSPSLLPLKSVEDNDWLRCDSRESFVQNHNIKKNILLASSVSIDLLFFFDDLVIKYFL